MFKNVPILVYIAYFAVLYMLINKRFVLRPTSALRGKKKLKSYGGGQLYHILEGVMFLSF